MKNNKILLINSPYTFPDPEIRRLEPLGLEYLAASLKNAHYNVEIWDSTLNSPIKVDDIYYHYGPKEQDIIDKINQFRPGCVAISAHYTYSKEEAYILAKKIKSIDKNIIIIMGGLFVSVYNELALQESEDIDYCLIGEGEESFVELMKAVENKADKTSVDGLIYRKNGTIVKNAKIKYIQNVDSISFPLRDWEGIKTYLKGSIHKRLYGLGYKPALSILTSRSCPHRCSFCNMRLVHGDKWRGRSVENVIAEMDEIVFKYKAEHMFIMDDNFTLITDRAKNILQQMINKNYKIRWNTPNGISAKFVDDELATLMKRAGCANVCVAIETGSEYIRNVVMNKKVSNAEIENAIKCFKRAGIPVVGFLLVGMPGETKEYFNETKKFVSKLPLTSITVSHAVPFVGTQLYDNLIKENIISEDFKLVGDYFNTPLYETKDFTKADIIERKNILTNMFPKLSILEEIEKGDKVL